MFKTNEKEIEIADKKEMIHYMNCTLGDACNTCKSFIEGFKK